MVVTNSTTTSNVEAQLNILKMIEQRDAKIEQRDVKIEQLNEENQVLRQQLAEKECQLEKSQQSQKNAMATNNEEIAKWRDEARLSSSRLDTIEQLKDKLHTAQAQVAGLQKSVECLQTAAVQSDKEMTDLKKTQRGTESPVAALERELMLKDLREQCLIAKKLLHSKTEQLQAAQQQNKKLQCCYALIDKKHDDLKEEHEDLRELFAAHQLKLRHLTQTCETQRLQIRDLALTCKTQRVEIGQLEQANIKRADTNKPTQPAQGPQMSAAGFAEFNDKITKLKDDNEALKEDREEFRKQRDQLQAELDVLKLGLRAGEERRACGLRSIPIN
eukprot:TRINITY_DN66411_c4_g1_i2.p2 TRINITY_DN66411_c4_g1~~TRINITY_DN66411_c4_g1_i2.p2  ORF type:complete len:331 (-),score=61.72 TRINITY_DN66411_c4_g1_i2:2639-3631(-)